MAVLGSPSPVSLVVSTDVKQHFKKIHARSELRRCVKVEVAVPGALSLIVLMSLVDVKQQ